MLSFQNLSLRRGPSLLIDQVSLTIYAGQKVGLIGANGIGKTSLFKLILGELDSDQGQIDLSRGLRIAHMAQELPAETTPAIDYVLSGDVELSRVQQQLTEAQNAEQYDRIGKLFEQVTDLDGFSARARAAQLMVGLGFETSTFEEPLAHFSGGWRVRLNLARTLMKPSDLLLLDEPTNHLDLDAIFWLAGWIQNYQGTLLLISHDREFLDDCVNCIAHMSNQNITLYSGNYSGFETLRAEQLKDQARQFEKQQSSIKHMEDFIRRFRYKDSKAKQAQSRIKALERLDRVAAVHESSPFRFSFRQAAKQSDPLISLRDATLGYTAPVLSSVNLTFAPGDRLGLLGVNGAGKSTLIKSLTGDIPLLTGERIEGLHLKVGYFSQHQVDDLDLSKTPISQLQQIDPNASELAIRTFLGGFNFSGDRVDASAENFSGGEKARLALAIVSYTQPNLLLLDEPTNHLDMEMRQALATAMNTFHGAILLISHDRYLLGSTVEQFLLVEKGAVRAFEGNLSDYGSGLSNAPEVNPAHFSKPEPTGLSDSETMASTSPHKNHKRSRQIATRIKTIDSRLTRLNEKRKAVEEALSDPKHYSDPGSPTLQPLLRDQQTLIAQIEALEEEWLNLEDELETPH
ncbi:MAG: ABC-F family ATP-binding cassette domain-containing protein [Pseudomonadales bacterium]